MGHASSKSPVVVVNNERKRATTKFAKVDANTEKNQKPAESTVYAGNNERGRATTKSATQRLTNNEEDQKPAGSLVYTGINERRRATTKLATVDANKEEDQKPAKSPLYGRNNERSRATTKSATVDANKEYQKTAKSSVYAGISVRRRATTKSATVDAIDEEDQAPAKSPLYARNNKRRPTMTKSATVDANKEEDQKPAMSLLYTGNKGDQAPTKSRVVAGNRDRGQTPTLSSVIRKPIMTEADCKDTTSTTSSRANDINSLLLTPSLPPSIGDAYAIQAPIAVGSDRLAVMSLDLSRQPLQEPPSTATFSSNLNNENRRTVKRKREEELAPLLVEDLRNVSGEAKANMDEKGSVEIVVNYNDKRESKRVKVKSEAAYEESLVEKDTNLEVGLPKGQFEDFVDVCDESSMDTSCNVALPQTAVSKKRPSQSYAESNRGKAKKRKRNRRR
ncbi:hypothetical protein BC936DRAFT_144627 [Jimgerdemannia flammicorona]|uniref:Uncharacterized protein n=1 Tax=Jimgerdemannia flammicorona TaxID=994334 RepID=A0A433DC42_9FUNG|nr:hypothetical protein BC936DRAFT_144627 [Jimgerdemannia flammicorona]